MAREVVIKPSRKDLAIWIGIPVVVVAIMFVVVVCTWLFTHDTTRTQIAVAIAVPLGIAAIVTLEAVVDRVRRNGHASRQLKKLNSRDVKVRLDAVNALGWLGRDAIAIVEKVGYKGASGVVSVAESRTLTKYVIPGLSIAARDSDFPVRSAAVRWLKDIGTVEALEVVERVGGTGSAW